jgi:acyl carrier protein
VLADIWREVLRVEHVGVHDNFFSLGGHSLLATRVTSRVQQRLGVRLPLAAFFRTPTIEAIAPIVDETTATHRAEDGNEFEEFTL